MRKTERLETKQFLVQNWRELLGALSGFVAIIYGIGFLITNVFLLSAYEIYDFGLLKARYIYVGAIFSMFLFISFWLAYFIYNNRDKAIPLNIRKYLVVRILYVIFVPMFLGMTIGTLVKSLLMLLASFDRVGLAYTAIQMRIWMILAIWVCYYVLWLLKSDFAKSNNAFPVPFSLFTGILIVTIFYARWVYPFMPFALGGGTPTMIKLVIDNEDATQLNQTLPINLANTTDTIYLIDQSESSYFVLVPTVSDKGFVHPVEIRKNLVLSIVHERNVVSPFLGNEELMPKITPSATATALQ